jgi:hypothetical protein
VFPLRSSWPRAWPGGAYNRPALDQLKELAGVARSELGEGAQLRSSTFAGAVSVSAREEHRNEESRQSVSRAQNPKAAQRIRRQIESYTGDHFRKLDRKY